MYLKYIQCAKMCKNVQKRAKTCKNVHLKYSFIKKTCKNMQNCAKLCKNVQKRAKTCKNVHLKYFWTQFKNVHLRGPCSLRPCISRPYCISQDQSGKVYSNRILKGIYYLSRPPFVPSSRPRSTGVYPED